MQKSAWLMLFLLVFCVLSTTFLFKFGSNSINRIIVEYQQHPDSRTKANNASNSLEIHQNCNHQKIAENFLKHIIALNEHLAEINCLINRTGNIVDIQNEKNLTKIGILIPTTTRKTNCTDLLHFNLFEKCLPSILNTSNYGYIYKIFVGFDASDKYFSTLNNLTKFHSNIKFISFNLVEVQSKTFVAAVNKIAQAAYEEGMDYFVRINDDTVFASSNWTVLAIDLLRSYDPPLVGVVGPTCDYGPSDILTHDMVHRSHLDIFPFYYPPVFENWWADDWITHVYHPNRSTRLKTWTVKHLPQTSRYVVDLSIEKKLSKAVKDGKIKLYAYYPVFKREQNSTVTPISL